MIKSMTGYGQATLNEAEINLTVEVKTLNSKFLDLNLRLPKLFAEKELEMRNEIAGVIERGKASVVIEFLPTQANALQQTYNQNLFISYYNELKKLADRVVSPSYDQLFGLALNAPGVIQNVGNEKLQTSLWEIVKKQLHIALAQCDDFRRREGKELEGKLRSYVEKIGQFLQKVELQDPARIAKIRSRIQGNVQNFLGEEGFDKNRLEQEIIFYIEKLDIHEERVRLTAHLEHFITALDEQEPNGKKLGFIAQEMGREINTIGSKANDAEIQKLVVGMKEELEKVKEQLSNVL